MFDDWDVLGHAGVKTESELSKSLFAADVLADENRTGEASDELVSGDHNNVV